MNRAELTVPLPIVSLVVALLVLISACGSASSVQSAPAASTPGPEPEGQSAGDDVAYPDVSLRYSSPLPESMSVSQGVEWFADEVEARSGGAVTIERFHGGSLLGAVDTLPAMQDGRIELGYMTAGYWPGQFPLWNLVGVPFLTEDSVADAATWMRLYEEDADLASEFDRSGVRPLLFMPLSQTVFGTSPEVGVIDDVDHLDGLRLRTIGYLASGLQAAGVSPVAVDPAELYESIQRGVLDGFAGWPFDVTTPSGLHEVAPNFVVPGTGQYTSSAMGISVEALEALPPAVRELLLEVATDYVDWAPSALAEAEDAACDALLDVGGTVTVWSEENVETLRELSEEAAFEAWRTDALATGLDASALEGFVTAYTSTYASLVGDGSTVGGAERCTART